MVEQIPRSTAIVQLDDQEFTLQAMAGTALIDWAEMQVLCCRVKVEAAMRLRLGNESDLRACLEQLYRADLNLVSRALGCEIDFADGLDVEQRRRVVETQDRLNQTGNLSALLAGQAVQAYVDSLQGVHAE